MEVLLRSSGLAARWQDRFDTYVLAAAFSAVVGVALQTLAGGGPLKLVGVVVAAGSWAVFVLDAAVMLTVSPEPRRWARGHWFELMVLVLTFPLWPVILHRLLLLELLPALTVLEAAKLAKLAKVVRAVRHSPSARAESRLAAAALVTAAAVVGVLVITH